MTDQEEFENWFLSNLPESSMPMMDYVLRKGYSEKAWQACAERKNSVIAEYQETLKSYEGIARKAIELAKRNEQQAKEIEALRGFASELELDVRGCDGSSFIDETLLKHKLLDENGNPTKLLTGEK